MSRRTDAPPPTADRDLDRVAATLRARFDREAVVSASRPEPVPNLSPSDGSLSLGVLPPTTSLPPVAAREVPLIRPGAAASARADPLAARALAAAVAAVSRYAREETARLAAFARTLELEIRNADTVDTVALEARRAALDACARRATLAGDILEHAIDVIDASFESFESFDRSIAHDAHDFANNLPSLRASFEPVVLAASAAYAAARARTDPGAGEPLAMGKTWRPPDAFERKTAKYWVEPRHVLALKLELAKHLPVLVFETADSEKSDFENTKKKNKNTSMRDGGAVTSVYLDSQRGDVYESRLTREQGATLVRVRWYGDDDVDDDDVRNTSPVFVERKTHHESWSRDGSTKERFALRRNDARAYVSRRSPPVANANFRGSVRQTPPLAFLFDKGDQGTRIARTRLADEITRFELDEKNITPSVRTEYRRVAFQRSDDNAVRVSLDVDLTFADARGIDDWDGVSRESGSAKVKHAFPFAVLEIKTRDETPPEWVERALRSAPCVEVRKFSKFLHATMLTRRGESQTGAARAPHWWSDESDAGVDPLAVRRQIMTDPTSIACCALERDDVVVTVGPSSSGPGPRPGLPADVRKKKGAEPSAGTDLESGLMDPARDDASEGGSGSGSGSSVSGVTRDERVFLSRFLLGGGVGAREGTRPKAPRAPRSLFLSRAFRFARGGNDAGDDRNRATHAGKTRNSSFGTSGTSTVVPRYVPVKVEPKTFFANERTLLQWLSMSVLLLFAALALLNNAHGSLGTAATAETMSTTSRTTPVSFAPNDAIRETRNAGASGASGVSSGVVSHNASFLGGAALAPVSIAFMAYALWTYLWRARRIARREPSARYDDIAGPTALVVVLVIVSSVAAAVAVADAARRFA